MPLPEDRIVDQVADLVLAIIAFLYKVLTKNPGAAPGRSCQAQQQLDGGGLSGPIGSQEPTDRVLPHSQVQRIKRLNSLVGVFQAVRLENRGCLILNGYPPFCNSIFQ